MQNWEDYKNHVKASSDEDRRNLEEIEMVSDIVSSIIRRQDPGKLLEDNPLDKMFR